MALIHINGRAKARLNARAMREGGRGQSTDKAIRVRHRERRVD